MKKLIKMILTGMMVVSLAACGSPTSKLLGTWEVDHVEAEGTTFTVSELKAMGDYSLSTIKIIIKEGSKAYLEEGDSGNLVDWEETKNGLLLNNEEYPLVDGMICVEYGEAKIYFKKVSDSQRVEETQSEEEKEESVKAEGSSESSIPVQTSPDKYTWYIKNYVGKNCASLGYVSMGKERLDTYGAGYIRLIFVTPDSTYIDIENEDDLKQYVVTGQNIEPNTELKLSFQTDSEGKEYDNLVLSQSYEEIILSVQKIGESNQSPANLTPINPSDDKYTWYIADYVGRNLANCGYTSIGGSFMNKYGAGYIKLIIVSEDGSYIDPNNTESLKNYVVTGQNIAPNTELTYVFETDSQGKEYENLVSSQNIEEVELMVKSIEE